MAVKPAGRIVVLALAILPVPGSTQVARTRLNQPASPYTAEYRITNTQRLADGNLIDLESKEVIAVDSQNRRMSLKTETLVPEDHPLGTRVIVTDPVARTLTIWTSPGERATVDTLPEPGAPRSCSANTTRGDAAQMGEARTQRSKPVIEDLGTDTISGIEAHGIRRTTTVPAGEIGNQAPLVSTRETWMAVSRALAGLVVREISDDPRNGKKTRELVSIDQREPDEATFQPPAGFEIVHRTSQTTCSTEAAPTPQP